MNKLISEIRFYLAQNYNDKYLKYSDSQILQEVLRRFEESDNIEMVIYKKIKDIEKLIMR